MIFQTILGRMKMNKKRFISNIKNEYTRNHLLAIDKARLRKEKYYDLYPKLQELDEEISSLTLKCARLLVKGKSLDHENDDRLNKKDLIESFKKDHLNAVEKKKKFLLDKKIPLNYKEPLYKCSDCEDTGYIEDGTMCHCYKQKLTTYLYDMSNIHKNMLEENFENFNIKVFSKEVNEKYGLSPRDNMKRIYNNVKAMCDGIIETNGIIFSGSTGQGKTYLCNCIAKYMIEKNQVVLYQTSINLVERIRDYKMSMAKDMDIGRSNYYQIFDADVLIIDDLGTELNNSFVNSELFNIINERMIAKKLTVISTNLSDEQLKNTYSDRISSRLMYNYDHFLFFGDDLRIAINN